jgi:hypothetical protein
MPVLAEKSHLILMSLSKDVLRLSESPGGHGAGQVSNCSTPKIMLTWSLFSESGMEMSR